MGQQYGPMTSSPSLNWSANPHQQHLKAWNGTTLLGLRGSSFQEDSLPTLQADTILMGFIYGGLGQPTAAFTSPPKAPAMWTCLRNLMNWLQIKSGHLWNLGPKILVLLRILQEIHKLHDLQLGLFAAGHILELHFNVVLQDFCCRLCNTEDPASSPSAPTSHWSTSQSEQQEAQQQKARHHAQEKGAERGEGQKAHELQQVAPGQF